MDTSWAALGSSFYTALDAEKLPISKMMPTARVGLLVASPALRIAEGDRKQPSVVTLTLDLDSSVLELNKNKILKLVLILL